MARPAGSLNKRTISANTTTPGEVKSFSLEHFLKKWRRTKMGDIPGRFHLRQRARNKNSVPEQRTGSLPAIQQRQNNLYAMYTPDVHLSAVMAEHGCAGEYNPGENAF
ncbi:TPA: hypothetical protein KL522_004717 [Escherichia coli]|jgi:hypothetical protein|uniref:hypothetical protein n=1 Tax=Escherichia coli TaxID=562 RepID=UPI0012FFABEB|nr:hypothetical protein [Escherichia coli]EEZ1298395.1 hypothetical protein [Escherichia coli]EFH3181325.1 hypothetical protein [Escherichia coli]EFH8641581.1 hypothetical protein [Escherichia coli]EFJ6489450.1 hypothetical protein [Escherichia coli]EFK3055609.1 hypothetical protein [Escherichia coli]